MNWKVKALIATIVAINAGFWVGFLFISPPDLISNLICGGMWAFIAGTTVFLMSVLVYWTGKRARYFLLLSRQEKREHDGK